MSKKPPITPDEQAQFRDAVKGVRPLKQGKHSHQDQPPHQFKPRETRTSSQEEVDYHEPILENLPPQDWRSGTDCLHFHRSGLQHRMIQKLKKGQVPIEAKLDLHRLTSREVLAAVVRFIEACQAQHIRTILLVHGKGKYSKEDKPILKNMLNQWLRTNRNVLAFYSAKPKHGGTGALYVLLKTKRSNDDEK